MTETESEPGFNLDDEKCQLAMSWTLNLVGQMLGAEGWAGGDGSESVEGDVCCEISNILQAAGLVDADGETLTAVSFAALRDQTIERCAVAAEAQDRTGREWVSDSLWANILARAGQNVRALKGQS